MTERLLAYDVCRCLGVGCSSKDTCARFLDKGIGAHWLSYCDNLQGNEDECHSYIPIEIIPIK